MVYRATLKWGGFGGVDALQTRTSCKFEAPDLRTAKRLAKDIAEINPDWMLEAVEAIAP